MPEELVFPFTFSQCPNCGSTRRIAEMATGEEISKGKIKPGSKTAMMVARTVVHDPAKMQVILAPQQVLVLLCAADVCVDCGTLYAVNVQKGTGVLEHEQQRPPGGQMPPFFGRG